MRYILIALCVLISSLTFGSEANEQAVGVVAEAAGNTWIKTIEGIKRKAQEGDNVYNGDVLIAGNQSYMSIDLFDGSELKLTGDSRIIVDHVIVDPQMRTAGMSFYAEHGRYYFSDGGIGRVAPENFKFYTPHADIGLHGSEFTAKVTPSATVVSGNGFIVQQNKRHLADLLDADQKTINNFLSLYDPSNLSCALVNPHGTISVIYASKADDEVSLLTEVSFSGEFRQRQYPGNIEHLYNGYVDDAFNGHVPKEVGEALRKQDHEVEEIEVKHFQRKLNSITRFLQKNASNLKHQSSELSNDQFQKRFAKFLEMVIEQSLELDHAVLELRRSIVYNFPNVAIRKIRLNNIKNVEEFQHDAYLEQLSALQNYQSGDVDDSVKASIVEDLKDSGYLTKIDGLRMEAKAYAAEAQAYGASGDEGLASALLKASNMALQKMEKAQSANTPSEE